MSSFGGRLDWCRLVWLFLGSTLEVIYVIDFFLFLNMWSLNLGYRNLVLDYSEVCNAPKPYIYAAKELSRISAHRVRVK